MEIEQLEKICKALGDNNRIAIMHMLQEQNLCASDILERLDITQPTLSHHMKLMTESGIVLATRKGTTTIYSVNLDCVRQIRDMLNPIAGGEKPVLREQEVNYQEKLLSIADEARRENAAKTDFLIRMSRDLRTSIMGIKGMVEIANKSKGNESQMEDCLQKMSSATERLEEMLDEILDMNDLEGDKEALVLRPFNVFFVAREINNRYLKKADRLGVTLKSAAKGEIKHPFILSGRVYAKRIFEMILDNSMKYVPRGGTISVVFEEVCYTEKTTTHRITISDDGLGVKMDEDGNAVYEGIGLSVVRRFIDKTGGTLSVKSEPGKGTCVTVELTFDIDKQTELRIANRSANGVSGSRILIVEDNDLNMEVAEFILSDAGATIVGAANGEEALNIIRHSAEGEFNLILMDIVMPGMDGYETTRAIRTLDREDTAKIPIIAMSANALEQDIKKSMDAGMNEYIVKPLNVNNLMNVLGQWIASER